MSVQGSPTIKPKLSHSATMESVNRWVMDDFLKRFTAAARPRWGRRIFTAIGTFLLGTTAASGVGWQTAASLTSHQDTVYRFATFGTAGGAALALLAAAFFIKDEVESFSSVVKSYESYISGWEKPDGEQQQKPELKPAPEWRRIQ